MKEVCKVVEFDKFELGIIINALNDLRTKLINETKDAIDVDRLILKVLDAPEKKRYFIKGHFVEDR